MSKAIEVDTKTFIRFWLVVVALGLIGLFISKAAPALIIIGLSAFLAAAIRPLAKKIDNLDRNTARPGLSSGLAVLLVVTIIGIALAMVGPVIVNETAKFVAQIPDIVQNADGLNSVAKNLGIANLQDQISATLKTFSENILKNLSGTVFTSIGMLGSVLTNTILVIVLTILFLIQGPDLLKKFFSKISNKNDKTGKTIERISTRIAAVISKYVTGQAIVALLDGTVTGITVFVLSLLLNFPSSLAFPMALIATILYLIPMFGPIITCIIVSLILLFQGPLAGISFLLFYALYAQIENNVIAPKVQGNSMELPTLIILVSITIGMYMFGLLGAIISIPIAGIIKVLIDEYPNIKALGE